MNQDNSFNQNNFNSQGNEGMFNNQSLNNQGFNQTMVNVNDIPVNVSEVQSNINLNNNMKENNTNKKSKKGLIITLSVIGGLVLLGIILLIINPFGKKEEEETKKLIENAYTMYVKINPLVKLSVKEKYYECKNEESGKFEKCGEVTDEVVSYNLVNNDAKEIYKDIDLKMKNVVDALVALYDTAREHEIEFTDIEITTNWDNRYSKVELVDAIKKQTKYSDEFNIVLDVEKGNITTSSILDKYGIEENIEIKYTIVFNSDGGTVVPEQEIKENEKVVKPSNPTRDGYNFIEWQLNGVKYNFDSEVKSDIELKAKWEQIVVKEETPKQEETSKEEDPPKQEETPKEEEPKQESTIAKINLNDNIYVELHDGINPDGMEMGYIITTNAEEIFGNDIFIADNGQKTIESYVDGFNEKYNQLVFNDALELSTLNLLQRMGSNLPAGVSSFACSKNDRRMINCQTKYLSIAYDMWDQFPILAEQLDNSVSVVLGYPSQAFSDVAVYISPGGMGFGPKKPVLLTEQICNQYHLTCDRW